MTAKLFRRRLAAGLVLGAMSVLMIACGPSDMQQRLFTVNDGRLYVCLTGEVADSYPNRCSEPDFGVGDQPELVGATAERFIEELGGDGAVWADAELDGNRLVRFKVTGEVQRRS